MTTNRIHIRYFVAPSDDAELSAKPTAHHGLGMATATRQMRDRVEHIMKEGLACDCCSAEIKALFTEWIECYGREHRLNQSNEVSNRDNTLRTKEIADKLITLMEACGSSFSAEEEAGKNGFHLDSKEPDWSKFRDFIMGKVRYNSLMKTFPQEAEELFVATERNAKLRYEGYKKLSEM